jgi:hypothetical protein
MNDRSAERETMYVICDAYARVYGWDGRFHVLDSDGRSFDTLKEATTHAAEAAKRIGDNTCVIQDYGLETQLVVAAYLGSGERQ